MIRYTDLKTGADVCSLPPFIAALGDFDGVHIGHKKVILDAIDASKSKGISTVVWFFADSPKADGERLTVIEEKNELFASLGADFSASEEFSAVKDMSCESFVKDYLEPLGCRGVACGYNFRFGKGAAGDVTTLEALCKEAGMTFCVSPPVTSGGVGVSSTKIREFLASGDAESAAEMLGRPYSVKGQVEHGRTLGAKIGFPTVNQYFAPGKMIPRHGVYFSYTTVDGKTYPSVSNVGSRPTVGGHSCRIETHILDLERELYGKVVEVSLVKFHRPEIAFSGIGELSAKIAADREAAKEFFMTYDLSGKENRFEAQN
ncbi:MAG: riboflavin biosynthesis protein RibF [Clostridia bacterium]|nr:riboflavin biosynthesis protein RibF [Clostridia bacterium]